ncbi:MAG: GMP synthase [Alphaproteobacteria bacterium]|nr:GMP synthase [Alphaproteobacteria bacterium]
MRELLIVQTGTSHPDVVPRLGDNDDWFLDALPPGRAGCDVVRPFLGDALPDPAPYRGLVLTGSPLGVRDALPWMTALSRWSLDALHDGTPVLAVCFGHQLLGEGLGGRVEKNPNGLECGAVEVGLTEAGRASPLFAGLEPTLVVQAMHNDVLVKPPPGATRLAGNANTTWQSFQWGPRLHAVQFHPEMRARVVGALLEARAWPGEVRASSDGQRILDNWWGMITG